MKRTVVITQPTYLPWLGYFEQMRRADVFIFLDSVQFERRSWQCRNRIKDANGEPTWLTVPLKQQPREAVISDILISTDRADWAESHLRQLRAQLGNAPCFAELVEVLGPILHDPPAKLADLNIRIIQAFASRLGLAPQFLRSSELPVTGRKADLIVNLLEHVGATDYYSAAGSAEYLEQARDRFIAAGIDYRYQTWPHPIYSQGAGSFVSHLTAADAISWLGFSAVGELLRAEPATIAAEPLIAHAC